MTDSAELIVKVRADASSLSTEMKKAEQAVSGSASRMQTSVSSLAGSLKGLIPALGVASLIGFAKQASLAADKLGDLSQRTGLAASTLSAVSLPLQLAGSSVDEFSSSVTRMNNAIGEAANSGNTKAFDDIGLSVSSLMEMNPEQQFSAIAGALNKITNQAEFTNKGMAIFGRSFASMSPLIRQVNGDLSKFVEEQQKVGNALTKEEIDMVSEFWDNYDKSVAKAEVAVIRFLNTLSKVTPSNLAFEAQMGAAAFKAGLTEEQKRSMMGRLSTERPVEPAEITFIKPQSQPQSKKTITQATVEAAKAQETYTAHIEDYKKAATESIKQTDLLADMLTDRLSSGLTDAVFAADSAGNAFRRMAESLARSIFEKSVAQPFASGITNAVSGSGFMSSIGSFFGNLLPSFDVGSPNIPQDMIAKVHKGEMIIPAQQANQIRNGGGSGATIIQNNTFQSGVTRSEVQNVLPQVAKAAHDAVFETIRKGGSAAKLTGAR